MPNLTLPKQPETGAFAPTSNGARQTPIDTRSRAEIIEDVAYQMLFLTENRAPGELEARAFAGTIGDKLNAVPTEKLQTCLVAATQTAAPYPPKIGDVLAAWKREFAALPRATFQDIEQREIDAKMLPALGDLSSDLPRPDAIFKRLGRCVVCNCPPDRWGPIAAQRDGTGRFTFWRCASEKCDLLVDANNENAVFVASVEPRFGAADALGESAPPGGQTRGKVQSRLELFCEECDLVLSAQSDEQKAALRLFAAWCDGGRPPIRVNAASFERFWAQWQFEVSP